MQDPPPPERLLEIVAGFLRTDVVPNLPANLAFHARVAANAVDLARRQITLAPPAEAAEHERLRALLGRDGTLEELTAELCRRLRSGELDRDTPELISHLRRVALDKLAVDQPGYSAYRRALETWPQEASAHGGSG